MRWLLLRGLAREQRHFGAFPSTFGARLGVETRTIDLPGFGTEHKRESPLTIRAIVDDVRGRFRAAGDVDGPWSIFAISLGGMVALDWAARYPGEWQRVVVANTSAADLSAPWERFTTRMWPKLPRLVASSQPEARERAILDITCNARSPDEKRVLAAEWVGYHAQYPPLRRSFARQLLAATRSRLPEKIEAPVHVLTSRADRLVSHRCSERIAAKLGCRIDVHDAAGHDLSLDAPDWICDKIAA